MEKKFLSKKKIVLLSLAAVAIAIGAILIMPSVKGGEKPVGFKTVKSDNIPEAIMDDVIPEYKSLERALACVVGDDVYVIVSRGEKPSSGFGVKVNRMTIEEKDGKSNLVVYALFKDPLKETTISQIITYPVAVAKTELKTLPNTIELRIEY